MSRLRYYTAIFFFVSDDWLWLTRQLPSVAPPGLIIFVSALSWGSRPRLCNCRASGAPSPRSPVERENTPDRFDQAARAAERRQMISLGREPQGTGDKINYKPRSGDRIRQSKGCSSRCNENLSRLQRSVRVRRRGAHGRSAPCDGGITTETQRRAQRTTLS